MIIISNAAQCLVCGQIIESRIHQPDPVRCWCGTLGVSGGRATFYRRLYAWGVYQECSQLLAYRSRTRTIGRRYLSPFSTRRIA